MDYKIERKEAFSVYDIEKVFTIENGENLKAIPQFWDELLSDGRYEDLKESTHLSNKTQGDSCLINAICDCEPVSGNMFPYMIFAFKTDNSDTSAYKTVGIPSAT